MANSLTKKWNLTNTLKLQIECLTSCVNQRTAELHEAKDRLQENIAQKIAETVKDQPQDDAAAAFRQKEEFLAIMSHEILMPINELVGKVNLLSDSPLSPGQREHATTIQKCAQDLLALLNDMHEFMAGWRQDTRAGNRQ